MVLKDKKNRGKKVGAKKSQTKVNPITEAYKELLEKDIIDLIGGKNFTDKQKDELYEKMLDTIMNRVIVKISERLSDEELKELNAIAEKGNKDKFFVFFKKRKIDINQMFIEQATVYKVEMVALTSQGGENVWDTREI